MNKSIVTLLAALASVFTLGIANTHADTKVVAFNAWGGSPVINAYIEWVGDEMQKRHGITLEHVKLTDTGSAVSRILAEKTAGRNEGGSVDLIWVNGENFASLKRNGLLRDDAWAFDLPSFAYTDSNALPAIINDFALPTDGLESPWGRAQLVFGYDSAVLKNPPKSAKELKKWIIANPGRFTFALPPNFSGTTFLKQIALETATDRGVFANPPSDANMDTALAPLWAWLEATTPHLWRGGKHYPANSTEGVQLLADGEIEIAMQFNPAGFSNDISTQVLPDSVRTYIHKQGTIANVHFVAIPFNASAPDSAKIVADFLLSPEAQIRKANPDIWGDPTVLAMDKLSDADRKAFDALPRGIATLSAAELSPSLPEPHPDWIPVIEKGWQERFGVGN